MKTITSRDHACCSVFFPGHERPTPDSMSSLSSRGLRVSPGEPRAGIDWTLDLEHPEWGRALLMSVPDLPLPTEEVLAFTFGLSEPEKETIAGAGHALQLATAGPTGNNALRERKALLRFGNALMGSDGLAVADHTSQIFWSPRMLEDELCHEADLDITSVFVTHAVYAGERGPDPDDPAAPPPAVQWMHTHGLAELGGFDFDILNPSEDLRGTAYEMVRALAFAIAQGDVEQGEEAIEIGYPGAVISLLRADVFQARASRAHASLREHDEEHSTDRVVVCDPPARGPLSFLNRRPRPSRYCSRPIREGTVFHFTESATELMAARARNTFGVFRAMHEEFTEFELPALVKLGYPTEGGGREHLWFSVHGFTDAGIDATLENQPHGVDSMHAGDRATHDPALLTDWTIMTPLGSLTPRDFKVARILRAEPQKLREMFNMMRMMGGG